jgi:hypothetical protein
VRDAATHETLSMSTATMVHAEVAAECTRAKAPPGCDTKQAPAQ